MPGTTVIRKQAEAWALLVAAEDSFKTIDAHLTVHDDLYADLAGVPTAG